MKQWLLLAASFREMKIYEIHPCADENELCLEQGKNAKKTGMNTNMMAQPAWLVWNKWTGGFHLHLMKVGHAFLQPNLCVKLWQLRGFLRWGQICYSGLEDFLSILSSLHRCISLQPHSSEHMRRPFNFSLFLHPSFPTARSRTWLIVLFCHCDPADHTSVLCSVAYSPAEKQWTM